MRNLPEPVRLRSLLMSLAFVLLGTVPAWTQTTVSLPDPLRLADCLAISQERQPSLAVARARLAATQAKVASLEALNSSAVGLIRHDLPSRLEQARLGVEYSRTDLVRLETENRYVVTRAYLSLLYSRAQQRALDELVEDLRYLRERVRLSVEKKERPEWTAATVDLITLYLRRAEARRTETVRGIGLSEAALREALNLEPCVHLPVPDEAIPQPQVRVIREEILAAAASRRGEALEANMATEAAELEVDAQSKTCRRGLVHTFAAGADLHAKHVPQPIYGEEFRPGGIPLYMPAVLVGSRTGRVANAQELSAQASYVAQKTRNLILLEAEEAYYNWQEWSNKVVLYREAEEVGLRVGRALRQQFRGQLFQRVIEGALPEILLAAQAQTDYNEAVFRQAIALAGLERVTGGAFNAGLANPPPP